jgi:hypothetical protein
MFDNDIKGTQHTNTDNPDSDIRGIEMAARGPHLPGDGYLSICGLFSDAVSNSDYIASNDRVINEQ